MITEFIDSLNVDAQIALRIMPDSDIKSDIIQTIMDIPFMYNLLRFDRKRARDLPKNSAGKITVNITEPHILEDMDFFRERAIYYKNNGVYTDLVKNTHPQSSYMRFWNEEMRRCSEGLVRPSDGEWIPGVYYWYLNYSPIQQAKVNTAPTEEQDVMHSNDDFSVAGKRVHDFPQVWDGDYLWFHYLDQSRNAGKHASNLKTRGRGYSLKAAAIMSNNYYIHARSNSFVTASDAKYLYGGDGVLDKTWDTLNFIDNNTPWKKARDYVDKMDRKRASYKDPRTKTERGYKSQIIGISTNGDPEKVRGLRGRTILNEEAGKYPDLLTAYAIERPSVEQGNITYGQIITWGTGGSVGADFEGIKSLFRKPKGYRIYPLPNVFDKKAPKGDMCGFYHGEYLNRENCMDSNGNSDIIKALREIFLMRDNIRKETTDPNAIVQEKADRSITPDEAMMKREGSLFNIEDLKIRQSILETDSKLLDSSWKVKLYPEDGIIKYKIDNDNKPIYEFPIRETKGITGVVEIWEQPIDNSGRGLFIAGCDPYDDDIGTSLGSMLIMNRLTRRIVAEYTGRPNTAEDFYETCLRLLRYYNAMCNYENNKKGMFQYFDRMNSTHLLADTPQILRDLEITKMVGHGNTSKGTNTNKATNSYGNSLTKSYLVAPAYNREGEYNWNTIRSVGLLKELIAFDPEEGNYDRISALKMLLIYEADLHRHAVLDPDSENNNHKPEIDRFFLKHRGSMVGKFEPLNTGDNTRKMYRR